MSQKGLGATQEALLMQTILLTMMPLRQFLSARLTAFSSSRPARWTLNKLLFGGSLMGCSRAMG